MLGYVRAGTGRQRSRRGDTRYAVRGMRAPQGVGLRPGGSGTAASATRTARVNYAMAMVRSVVRRLVLRFRTGGRLLDRLDAASSPRAILGDREGETSSAGAESSAVACPSRRLEACHRAGSGRHGAGNVRTARLSGGEACRDVWARDRAEVRCLCLSGLACPWAREDGARRARASNRPG